MTIDQATKILNSRKASKEQLRSALAAALGVDYKPFEEKSETLFTQFRDIFLDSYRLDTDVDYSFTPSDGRSLAQLVFKVKNLSINPTNETIVATWRQMLAKLPEWYKKNAYSLPVINSKFNEIVASIKKNNDGKQGITDSYKARVLNDLTI